MPWPPTLRAAKNAMVCIEELLIYRELPVCPVIHVLACQCLFGEVAPRPLLCWTDGPPISSVFFTQSPKETIKYCDLEEARYETHSFRIGAASWPAAKGVSDTQIRVVGR